MITYHKTCDYGRCPRVRIWRIDDDGCDVLYECIWYNFIITHYMHDGDRSFTRGN